MTLHRPHPLRRRTLAPGILGLAVLAALALPAHAARSTLQEPGR